ncbi:MAG: glucose-1-phosphate thymidylyltransferase [Bacteroidales bacterium]|nr:glucose-1-phosphate thymidylyltransferase [Bacteroidales bacterium]HOY37958.1 putative sugar nucleotidyl transferase [Bacteroidales bacterium]HQP03185.1 putative sugar nucleotidyl transferase [Bacteroidales bacterium]
MKNYILSDAGLHKNLLPITFTRPVSEIRSGILTNTQRWQHFLGEKCSFLTEIYLQKKFPASTGQANIWINGGVVADKHIAERVLNLQQGSLMCNGVLIAAVCVGTPPVIFDNYPEPVQVYDGNVIVIQQVYDIFGLAAKCIDIDFELLAGGRVSNKLSKTNTVIGDNPVFLEEGAIAEASVFNTTNGPIYLGKHCEVMEGSMIRGPFCLLDHSVLKMGAKIYGPTIIGPHSKIGGELNNVVILGLSNKAHDGFLGNSVIGEWCNLGADTNNSNLKNNYAMVKLWNYEKKSFLNTGLQFCGLIMGDHSKCGINTMFNTGTVVGVSANIFGSGFPRNYIPSFSWGGASGFVQFGYEKAIEVAGLVMKRRNMELDNTEKEIFKYLFDNNDHKF